MAGIARLIHEGYKMVGRFNNEERAKLRAELHRRQGFDAKVRKVTDRWGIDTYMVYIKKQEV